MTEEQMPAWCVLSHLLDVATRFPDQRLFTFVDEGGQDQEHVTASQLVSGVSSVAGQLKEHGLYPGDRVLLACPPSLDFVRAFLGCLAHGSVPVPVYPPNPMRPGRELRGFAAIAADCEATAVLTNAAYQRARTAGSLAAKLTLASASSAGWPALPWHRIGSRSTGTATAAHRAWYRPSGPAETAFLQYTSGSTTAPRGVEITHGNLTAEIRANAADLGLGADARGVFWVPPYHDMGLISVILSTAAGNAHTYLLSPFAFLARPATWFDVMSRVRATHTAAPDFAFDLALRRTTAEQRRTWDLSALRVLMSAAEPIRPDTVDAFLDAFAVSGLPTDAFYAAYGLAEHTVSVTMGGRNRLTVDRQALESGQVVVCESRAPQSGATVRLASCGRVTKQGQRLQIVDPESRRRCPAGEVGEIWVDSPTKAAGYFGREEESAAVFQAVLEPSEKSCGSEASDAAEASERSGTFLRTGDLGFLHDGELYVTGRIKDLIISFGRNLYPQDLENTVRDCHPAIRPGGVAAVTAHATGEVDSEPGSDVVLFAEIRTAKPSAALLEEVGRAVRHVLATEHHVVPLAVVLGRPGLVAKTTSGKVRRHVCRQHFLDGTALSTSTTWWVWDRRSARQSSDSPAAPKAAGRPPQ
ncbi:fatty acyl-AMP ligase [Streptomyces sp. NPDC054841]